MSCLILFPGRCSSEKQLGGEEGGGGGGRTSGWSNQKLSTGIIVWFEKNLTLLLHLGKNFICAWEPEGSHRRIVSLDSVGLGHVDEVGDNWHHGQTARRAQHMTISHQDK